MNKLYLLIGIAIGYVLGARAGHERYEEIRTKSQEVWHSDAVQDRVSGATEAVKAKAPAVSDKVAGAAKNAKDKAMPHSESDTGGTSYTAGQP